MKIWTLASGGLQHGTIIWGQLSTSSGGSYGLDIVIFKNGSPALGIDLKSGNARFSQSMRREIERRFNIPVIEINPCRP
jgi:hypothetical protein